MGADYSRGHGHAQREPPTGPARHRHWHHRTIRRAILDKNVCIGSNVQILNKDNVQNFETDQYVVCDGIVIIPKNTVIPDNTVI